MPEQIKGSNMWKVFPDEEFITVEGEYVSGPKIVRILEYPDLGVLGVQAETRIYNVVGKKVEDFENSVQKKQ